MVGKRNNYTTDHARRLGYRSGFEAEVAKELDRLLLRYEYESPNVCTFKYFTGVRNGVCTDCKGDKVQQARVYTCDFFVAPVKRLTVEENKRTKCMFIETKGRFTASDRSKMEAVIKQNPLEDIRILFQYDGKATPKRSYTEWCEWKGIKCAVIDKKNKRYIPIDWLEELGITEV